MDDRKKPMIARDDNNKVIDIEEGRRIAAELTQKLVSEQRKFDKDNSMHFAKTGKRDVVVHLAVTILGQVNGVNIIGEPAEKEVGQWCFRLNAQNLPMRTKQAYRPLAELANIGKQALMRIGAIIS